MHSTHVGANDPGLKSVLEVDKLLKMTQASNWKCRVSATLFAPEFLKMGNCTPIFQHLVVTVNDLKDTVLVRQGPQLNVWRLCFCHFLSPIYQLNVPLFRAFLHRPSLARQGQKQGQRQIQAPFLKTQTTTNTSSPSCLSALTKTSQTRTKKTNTNTEEKTNTDSLFRAFLHRPTPARQGGALPLGLWPPSHPRLCCSKPFPRFISAFAFVFLFVFVFAFVSAFAIVVLFVFELVSVSTVSVRNGNKVLSKRCAHR